MIKINLDYGQINRINKIIKQDIESNLKEDFEKVTNVLKKYECTKTLELVDDEEKLYEACTLFGKTALTEYSDKFKCAFDTDIIGRDDYKEIHKYLCCEFEKIYKNFSNRKSAYEIASIINANVCPYCNRIYTFTIAKKTRPQFDHFFPKALYPWLAISIYNLIPSCGLCNTGKSKKNPIIYFIHMKNHSRISIYTSKWISLLNCFLV